MSPSGWTSRAAGWLSLAAVVVVSWTLRFAGHGTGTPLDTVTYFLPVYQATAERLAHGVVPLWNPYQLAGIPWLATWQGGVLYPFHVLYLALPLHVAFMASNVGHLLMIALATAAFVRRLGLSAPAAFVAAVVVGLRGHVPSLLFAPNQLEAVAWLPIGAIACIDVVQRPAGRRVALLAVATAMSLLAGYPQPTTYVVYTWITLLAALAIDARLGPRRLAGALLCFGVGVGVGALLAGVQLLPAVELARLGVRAPRELAERAMFAMGPLLSPALMPLRFGAIVGSPWTFGLAVLALLPTALAATRHRAIACWAVLLSVLTVLFALGELTPAFALYRALPGLGWFRIPSRILVITEFTVAIAAAFGVDALLRSRTRAATGRAAAIATIAAGAVAWLASEGWAPADHWTGVVARAGAFVAGVVMAAAGSRIAGAVATAAIAGLVLFEASAIPWLNLRLPYAASDVARMHVLDEPLRRLAATAGHARIWHYGQVTILQPESMLKLATLNRFRAIVDYEPLSIARQANYFAYLTEATTARERPPWLFAGTVNTLTAPPGVPGPAQRRRLLDLLATRLLLTPPGLRMGERELAEFLHDARWIARPDEGPLKVFENPDALPRAFVTYRTHRAPERPDDLLREISRPSFDPLAESFVEDDPLPATADAPRGHPVAFVRDGESEVELEATLERPGLVVLADTFYPGWHATVDGRPAPIVATNHLFRGVRADAGTHRVRFVYAPASLRAGAACTALGLVALAWLVRRRAGARPPDDVATRLGDAPPSAT